MHAMLLGMLRRLCEGLSQSKVLPAMTQRCPSGVLTYCVSKANMVTASAAFMAGHAQHIPRLQPSSWGVCLEEYVHKSRKLRGLGLSWPVVAADKATSAGCQAVSSYHKVDRAIAHHRQVLHLSEGVAQAQAPA